MEQRGHRRGMSIRHRFTEETLKQDFEARAGIHLGEEGKVLKCAKMLKSSIGDPALENCKECEMV